MWIFSSELLSLLSDERVWTYVCALLNLNALWI